MPVIKVSSHIEAYRIRAADSDLHQLAGRGIKEAVTEFVNAKILKRLELTPDDILVDIGCGDGCLLRKAEGVAARIGIVGSREESERLQKAIPEVEFRPGLVQKLPVETASATKVVCNSVLVLMRSEQEIVDALREIARIARPGAIMWVGEIPTADEYQAFRMYRGTSVAGMLWFLLWNHGLRTFLGMCRKLRRAWFGDEQIVLNSAGLYHAASDHFIALGEGCGLHVEDYFKHQELNSAGEPIDSKFRFNYIFRK